MSFRTLLPIGRAFDATSDRAGRYQVADAGLPALSPGGARPAGRVQVTVRAAAGVDRPAVPAGRRLPVWLEQVVLALLGPGKNRRRGRREVQSEFSFQEVRVARNDLSTADVELVPARASLSPACRTRVLKLWWDQGAERLKRLGGALR